MDDWQNETDEEIIYLRFKNGQIMMGMVDEETDTHMTLSGAMDVVIIDQGQYSGMSIQPAIPYGIDQPITLSKGDILFRIKPNETLTTLYLDRSEEAVEILMTYLQKVEEQRKKKAKSLN